MCLFTHVAAGALAGAFAPSPFVAPLFGLGSHIVLDVMPHYDFERMRVEISLAVAAFAVLVLGGAVSLSIVLGALFGILPDLENLFWKLGKIRDDQKVFPGHRGWIRHGPPAGIGNIYLQGIGTVAILAFLVWRGR